MNPAPLVQRRGSLGAGAPVRLPESTGDGPAQRINAMLRQVGIEEVDRQLGGISPVVLAGLDIAEGSTAARGNDTPDIDDVCRVVENDALPPERIAVFSADSARLDPSAYRRHSGTCLPVFDDRISTERLSFFLTAGGSLAIQRAGDLFPGLRRHARWLAWATGATVTVNLYLSLTDHSGLGQHWDEHDVLVVQLRGRKHWLVQETPRTLPLRERAAQIGLGPSEPPPPGPPIVDSVLSPGDVVFIPRGTWHTVTPVGEPTLHATFALSYPLAGSVLAAPALGHTDPRADVRPTDPLIVGASGGTGRGEPVAEHLARLDPTPTTRLSDLSSALIAADLDGWSAAWSGGPLIPVDGTEPPVTYASAGAVFTANEPGLAIIERLSATSPRPVENWWGDAATTRIGLCELALDGLVELVPPGDEPSEAGS